MKLPALKIWHSPSDRIDIIWTQWLWLNPTHSRESPVSLKRPKTGTKRILHPAERLTEITRSTLIRPVGTQWSILYKNVASFLRPVWMNKESIGSGSIFNELIYRLPRWLLYRIWLFVSVEYVLVLGHGLLCSKCAWYSYLQKDFGRSMQEAWWTVVGMRCVCYSGILTVWMIRRVRRTCWVGFCGWWKSSARRRLT